MFKRIVLTGSFALALALVIPAHADTIYSAVLLGSNEVPPTGSPATGVGIFTLSGNMLTINETFTGLTAPAANAVPTKKAGRGTKPRPAWDVVLRKSLEAQKSRRGLSPPAHFGEAGRKAAGGC